MEPTAEEVTAETVSVQMEEEEESLEGYIYPVTILI